MTDSHLEGLACAGFLLGPAALIASGPIAIEHGVSWLGLTVPVGIAGMAVWFIWAWKQ